MTTSVVDAAELLGEPARIEVALQKPGSCAETVQHPLPFPPRRQRAVFGNTTKKSRKVRDNRRSEMFGDISVISKDMQVMGGCTSQGRLRIHGKVSGDVTARGLELTLTGSVKGDVIGAECGDGDLLFVIDGAVDGRVRATHVEVGRHGSVTRGVVADTAVIHGRVQGGILASDRLALEGTAVVVGDVHTRRLSMMEGGVVNGTIRMGEPATKERPSETGPRDAAAMKPVRESFATASRERSELSSDSFETCGTAFPSVSRLLESESASA